jgi:hypothetical protein
MDNPGAGKNLRLPVIFSMAFNYYEGWSESKLLEERKLVQKQLSVGRTTEVRLAGETTKNDDRMGASLELTLQRLAYALFELYRTGKTQTAYTDPHAVITIQSHY